MTWYAGVSAQLRTFIMLNTMVIAWMNEISAAVCSHVQKLRVSYISQFLSV